MQIIESLFINWLAIKDRYFDLIKVNETSFHPNEKIIASCSSDRSIIIGEIPEVTL